MLIRPLAIDQNKSAAGGILGQHRGGFLSIPLDVDAEVASARCRRCQIR